MNVNDNINLEYEARVMITENQYSQIKETYLNRAKDYKETTNTNYYFDLDNLSLKDSEMVLRARSIDDQIFELTLKIKEKDADVEVNHPLTSSEFNDVIENQTIPESDILVILKSKNVNVEELKIKATLKTERIEIEYPEYLFVIDKNYHNNRVDFNLEVESSSKKLAKSYLISIISEFDIEYKKDYISKSRRALYNL